MQKKTYFISGIDTDAGKSYATGFFARRLICQGASVITQKFVQTGCKSLDEISEDIIVHRKIMGVDIQDVDKEYITCPLRFLYPASADLASRMENRVIDTDEIVKSTVKLHDKYDVVLIEGAGGLAVPIKGLYTTLDYIVEQNLPLILVSNPKLGSINHTLLSLEVCLSRGIEVAYLLYNALPESSELIKEDTRRVIEQYLSVHFPECEIIDVPKIKL